ncbi:hypothetical protein QBC37DRAFT_430635 [Rhypophila decipiens]|uniref:Uncharacterized protein n=1 Tax=Rhypophila decipiens TaxID=261697 RepID=A0AAN6XYF8_9PEZI|nr:hypothetical protein QBC37DRAFT_430635 [Rhypophila decipiens]
MASNITSDICPGTSKTAMPSLGGIDTIPKDIDVVMITGNNVSHPAMNACCAPNKVQLLDGCYLWCKIPGGTPKLETKDAIFRNITSCLQVNDYLDEDDEGRGAVQANIVTASLATGSKGSLSTLGLGIWALAVFGGVLMG